MKKIIVMTLGFLLAGCAGQMIVLENDSGEQVTCEVSTGSAMLTGAFMRNKKIEKCVEARKNEGYTKVIEAK